jgi:hypothetical protein
MLLPVDPENVLNTAVRDQPKVPPLLSETVIGFNVALRAVGAVGLTIEPSEIVVAFGFDPPV